MPNANPMHGYECRL